ncbi:MAG: hypothetical protein NXI32_03890 [bacterium]|nr:hypothetical protein [bacterium]
MHNYARLSIFGILALIALRVGVGWHFYMEGASKVRGSGFSSQGFLVASQGPLADKFKSLIWDHDGKLRLDQAKMNGLLDQATERAIKHFQFTEDQQNEVAELRKMYFGLDDKGERWVGKLNTVYADSQEDIFKFWEGIHRVEEMKDSPTWTQVSSLRGQKEKIENDRLSAVRPALSSIDAIWNQYEGELNAIASDVQRSQSGYFHIARPGEGLMSARVADQVIPIFDMVVGILLMIGLLTPLAAWAAALFLISVILSQMPGYPGSEPTYYQAIECLACITLACTDAGRYAGLDFLPWSWWHNKHREAESLAST